MPKTKATTGKWTMESLIAKQEEDYRHEKELAAAVSYARGIGASGKKAMSQAHEEGLHLNITWNMVQNVLSGRRKRSNGVRMAWEVLTESETQQLVQWIKASAINKDAATDDQVSQQIVKMLKARRTHNRSLKNSVKAGGALGAGEPAADSAADTTVSSATIAA